MMNQKQRDFREKFVAVVRAWSDPATRKNMEKRVLKPNRPGDLPNVCFEIRNSFSGTLTKYVFTPAELAVANALGQVEPEQKKAAPKIDWTKTWVAPSAAYRRVSVKKYA